MKKLILVICLFALPALAVEDTSSSNEASGIARDRSYLGGIDEDDIKVKDPLPSPLKKLNESSVIDEVKESLFKEEEELTQENSEG